MNRLDFCDRSRDSQRRLFTVDISRNSCCVGKLLIMSQKRKFMNFGRRCGGRERERNFPF